MKKLCFRIIASVKNRLKLITQRSDNLDLSDHQHLPKILLDLANYRHNDLLQHSLLLLNRYYTTQRDIFQQALRTQLLLTPQSIELYNTIEGLFIELVAFVRSGSGVAGAVKDPSPIKTTGQSTAGWRRRWKDSNHTKSTRTSFLALVI